MNNHEIINAWKSEPEDRMANMPANPVGEELTDEQLATIEGGSTFISGVVCIQTQVIINIGGVQYVF